MSKKTVLIRFAAFLLAGIVFLFPLCACGKTAYVTREQILSGECNGQTVETLAVALELSPRLNNLIYIWAVAQEDGRFLPVDDESTRWMLSERDYYRAISSAKNAIQNGEPLVLKVDVHTPDRVIVQLFKSLDALGYGIGTLHETLCCVGALLVVLALFAAFCIWIHRRDRAREDELTQLEQTVESAYVVRVYADHQTTVKHRRALALARSLFGRAVAGDRGSMAGILVTPPKITTHTSYRTKFLILFKDGRRTYRTFSNDSQEYALLMRKRPDSSAT